MECSGLYIVDQWSTTKIRWSKKCFDYSGNSLFHTARDHEDVFSLSLVSELMVAPPMRGVAVGVSLCRKWQLRGMSTNTIILISHWQVQASNSSSCKSHPTCPLYSMVPITLEWLRRGRFETLVQLLTARWCPVLIENKTRNYTINSLASERVRSYCICMLKCHLAMI